MLVHTNQPLSAVKGLLSGLGIVIFFGGYIGLLILTAGGYCVKMLVDAVLTEIVTGFWRLGKKIGMGIEKPDRRT